MTAMVVLAGFLMRFALRVSS